MLNFKKIVCLVVAGLVFMASLQSVYAESALEDKKAGGDFMGIRAADEELELYGDEEPPAKSGAVRRVPWEDDIQFVKACEDNNTTIMLAAYRTVLRDPLPGEEENVHLAAGMLAGRVIKPGERFSQNGAIGPYIESRGFQKGPTYIGSRLTTTIGGGVCKIASTLYNVTILSNLEVVERYCHSMPVPYVPYGQDATVSYGSRDFKFRNNTPGPLLIWAQGIDNILYIAFYGQKEAPLVKWHHQTLNVQKAPKIYRTNSELDEGTEKVVSEGMDGATVKSWVTIVADDGAETTRNLGISYYKPMPYIIERNIKAP
ncbi:surface rod structure-forming protein G [Anaerobacterium chartisolvens]|uniref:Surface rod structure-forming protein G n=1 Tax=Anaerobacterium chartisolvens TaxID=1297424 RepID=A0A369BAJ4_9FIRM|nr:VanW family protein [Anaerobacterium chartisolvens]RCX17618.1 surface rod structure-forming protein G [Anaerobacterium chartisolvens]